MVEKFKGRDVNFNLLDPNECSTKPNPCTSGEECINMVGSYRCVCKIGHYRDGKVCKRSKTKKASLFLVSMLTPTAVEKNNIMNFARTLLL